MEYALSLTEYSTKYDVSVSTLRRKIKKSAILNKMIEGKYFLPDLEYRKLSQKNTSPPSKKIEVDTAPPQELESKKIKSPREYEGEDLEPLLEVKFVEKVVEPTQELTSTKKEVESVVELKEAFRMVLSEKENQITTLKAYIADLQTLNRVLESELERLELVEKKSKTSFYEVDFE